MMVRSRGRALSCATAALALALSIAGCGGDPEETDAAQNSPTPSDTTSPAEPETSTSPAESETPDEESTSPQATKQPVSAARTLADLPLSAAQVPGFNEDYSWTAGSRSMREGSRPFGTCQKFALTSIGAEKVTVRRYKPAPRLSDTTSTARNLVASMPDERTAKRVYEVLKSWRGQCNEKLRGHDMSEIGKLQPVDLPAEIRPATASADWYLLTYGPAKGEPDAGYFDAQGMVRVGETISMLRMRLIGQDYNYEPGQEPMVGAVRASAVKLAG